MSTKYAPLAVCDRWSNDTNGRYFALGCAGNRRNDYLVSDQYVEDEVSFIEIILAWFAGVMFGVAIAPWIGINEVDDDGSNRTK